MKTKEKPVATCKPERILSDCHLDVGKNGDLIMVRLGKHGVLDELTANKIGDELLGLADRPDCHRLLLDFSGVAQISSAMLAKLVRLHRKMVSKGEKLRVRGMNSHLRSVFASTKLDRLFEITDTETGVRMIQEPQQRTVKQARSPLKSCGVGPSLKLQGSPEPRNVTAEDPQAGSDNITKWYPRAARLVDAVRVFADMKNMHMTDYLIYHIQYVTLAPHPDRNSLDNLFRLLDHLDVLERDRMLAWMYLAFLEAPATPGNGRDRGTKV